MQFVKKAQQTANITLRCFVSRYVNLLSPAFIKSVRPVIGYKFVVWSNFLKCEIQLIERIQRRFAKRLAGTESLSYTARLDKLKLVKVELRRLHIDD